jgi:hypothetical protein
MPTIPSNVFPPSWAQSISLGQQQQASPETPYGGRAQSTVTLRIPEATVNPGALQKLPPAAMLVNQESSARTSNRPSFEAMRQSYQATNHLNRFQLGALLQGQVGQGLASGKLPNTCVIRLSRAFNESGHKIPSNLGQSVTVHVGGGRAPATQKDGKGNEHLYRVADAGPYLRSKLGEPDIRAEKPGSEFLQGKRGIVLIDMPDSPTSTGHVTLLDGTDCVRNECPVKYWNEGTVEFWSLP